MQKILVIEDVHCLRNDIVEVLIYEGYSAEGAENSPAGLAKVHSFSPDVIILDIKMPEMDGYSILEHIKKDPVTAGIRVIILGTRDDVLDIQAAMELGAEDYLLKPFHALELLITIRTR